ncbi:MAG: HPr family phosphocarrier protein [Candidatus Marinimicrobia bacterium]|jgi:phosphocarrier protein|nr:HPr family phosphocarrier protein [Candidatus Neomarinimicrobiota bacterium]MCK9560432.1 HPr family phosphocarrier protein [Candidatus Neomarinimicrobiota bacterium]MDD5062569.1 HPr family phosphocarrier protein [Candidatus Neomarinimicrobiota bacterium]MDD5541156.1 HPr family phosphocarrier protein [Candidatus Neomarinimicrobiota bacterium]
MVKKTVRILNRHGLHTRPATVLVTKAAQYKSEIYITYKNVRVNVKSILGVLVLAVEPDAEVTFDASGPDENEALAAVVDLVANKFNTE